MQQPPPQFKQRTAGIVGAGYISTFHANAIARDPRTRLVAVCDLDRPRADSLASKHAGAAVHTDFERMLSDTEPDVVHVLTQPDSHFALARVALEAGRDVIIEKPVAATRREAAQLAMLARRTGRTVAVNHNFVFSRPFSRLREMVGRGQLGPLKSIRIVWKKPLQQLRTGPWNVWMLRDPRHLTLEIGAHPLSELLAIVSDVEITDVRATHRVSLPSGSDVYQRFTVAARSDSIDVVVDVGLDHGYDQHAVEIEGLFGVARADIENDYFVADVSAGHAYDLERLAVNVSGGAARVAQAVRSYVAYGASKFHVRARGNPYESSMCTGIAACYDLLSGSGREAPTTIAYATEVLRLAEVAGERLPQDGFTDGDGSTIRAVGPSLADDGRHLPSGRQQRRALVVGANGFIGRRVVAALDSADVTVRALVRNRSTLPRSAIGAHVEVVEGDLRDADRVEVALKGVDVVVHLAVAHANSLEGYLQADSRPTVRFAEQCERHGVERFVYSGTIDSLDLASARVLTEADGLDDRLERRNSYARSKGLTEVALRAMHNRSGFPVVVVRPAVVLGVGGPITHPGVARWSGFGRCTYWGSGDNPLPLVLVEDVADAFAAAAIVPGIDGRSYNISAPSCLTARDYVAEAGAAMDALISASAGSTYRSYLADLVKWSAKALSGHPDRTRVPSLHDWRCREQRASFDTSAAHTDLGWKPRAHRDDLIEYGIRAPVHALLHPDRT